jgi:GMC oxidoreductase
MSYSETQITGNPISKYYGIFRFSTAAMYLRPAMEKAGNRLTVVANTLTYRVMFNGRRAIGIECKPCEKGAALPLVRAFARKEVCSNFRAVTRSNFDSW